MKTLPIVLACIVVLAAAGAYFFFAKSAGTAHPSTATSTTADAAGTYTDPYNGFSFAIPTGFHITQFNQNGGETVLVQSADASQGFQIFVTAFTDPGSSITAARVQSQAGIKTQNATPVKIAGAADGLAFDDVSDSPELAEAWFVYGGNLYQAEAPLTERSLLIALLQSWKFELPV